MPEKDVRARAGRKNFQPEEAAARWKHRKDLILFGFAIVMTGTISIICGLIIFWPDLPLKLKFAAAILLFFMARTFVRYLTGTMKL